MRKPKSVFVNIRGASQEYQILNVCEFNSTRKRMSTVIRTPEGKIKIYCKGADNVILERLAKNQPYTEKTLLHLEVSRLRNLRLNTSKLVARNTRRRVCERCAWRTATFRRLNTGSGLRFMTRQHQRSMVAEMRWMRRRSLSRRTCSCWARRPSRTNSRTACQIRYTHCRWQGSRSGY